MKIFDYFLLSCDHIFLQECVCWLSFPIGVVAPALKLLSIIAGQTRMIHVQTETKNLDISVDLACNVQGLKESIEEVEGIPVQQQGIILNGKELNHGEDLPQQDELTLQLVVKSESNVEESAAGN